MDFGDFEVAKGQPPLFITAGDDLSIILQLTTRFTRAGTDGRQTIFREYFPIQDGDVIQVILPGNVEGFNVLSTDITVLDSERGRILVKIPGSDSLSIQRFQAGNPGTFKAYLVRAGQRSTFLFPQLLVCKDDNFTPFIKE
jgi:hypothetical protein